MYLCFMLEDISKTRSLQAPRKFFFGSRKLKVTETTGERAGGHQKTWNHKQTQHRCGRRASFFKNRPFKKIHAIFAPSKQTKGWREPKNVFPHSNKDVVQGCMCSMRRASSDTQRKRWIETSAFQLSLQNFLQHGCRVKFRTICYREDCMQRL